MAVLVVYTDRVGTGSEGGDGQQDDYARHGDLSITVEAIVFPSGGHGCCGFGYL